jgi:hypothetical protein
MPSSLCRGADAGCGPEPPWIRPPKSESTQYQIRFSAMISPSQLLTVVRGRRRFSVSSDLFGGGSTASACQAWRRVVSAFAGRGRPRRRAPAQTTRPPGRRNRRQAARHRAEIECRTPRRIANATSRSRRAPAATDEQYGGGSSSHLRYVAAVSRIGASLSLGPTCRVPLARTGH